MKKACLFFCCLWIIGIFMFAGNVMAQALLVQTEDIWTYNANTVQPYEALQQAGISYDQVSHQQLINADLSEYNFIYLVGSDGETKYFDQYVDMNQIGTYVQSGGLVLIHYAEWNGDYTDIGPAGVDGVDYSTNTGNINPNFLNDPLFSGVTDDDLDNWSATAHGYLTNLPIGADILITNENGNPIYARYQYGKGEVWITTMTLEWGNADHDLLFNELKLANSFTAAVPLPSTLFLLGSGLLGVASYTRKRRC